MLRIRFSGVVRLATRVQRELSGPLPPQRCEELRHQVHHTIDLVERTLRVHGASPRAIPGPTRRALDFLRSVDFDQVQVADDARAAGRYESVTLTGLVARVEHAADRLAQHALHPDADDTHCREHICGLSARVGASADRSGVRPEELTSRSRAHLAWLRFLADPENLTGYVDAIRFATTVFEPLAAPERWPRPLVIHFRPTSSVYRVRTALGQTRVLLPTPMIAIDHVGFSVLGSAMFGRRDRRRNAALHAILQSEEYQDVQAELESLGGEVEDGRGMVHDLSASFDRVNAAYFDGRIPRPRVTWNRTITAGKFGHYNYSTDTVMISRALDRPGIPAFVVDHVMHHELLHKKHGLRWHNGRGHAHTLEFRSDEQQFAQYREADQFLRRLATRR